MPIQQFSVVCDKCNKTPDTFTMKFDPTNDVYVCIARCHGEFDRCVMPHDMLTSGWRISEARPFRQDDKTKTFKADPTPVPLCVTYQSTVKEVLDGRPVGTSPEQDDTAWQLKVARSL